MLSNQSGLSLNNKAELNEMIEILANELWIHHSTNEERELDDFEDVFGYPDEFMNEQSEGANVIKPQKTKKFVPYHEQTLFLLMIQKIQFREDCRVHWKILESLRNRLAIFLPEAVIKGILDFDEDFILEEKSRSLD